VGNWRKILLLKTYLSAGRVCDIWYLSVGLFNHLGRPDDWETHSKRPKISKFYGETYPYPPSNLLSSARVQLFIFCLLPRFCHLLRFLLKTLHDRVWVPCCLSELTSTWAYKSESSLKQEIIPGLCKGYQVINNEVRKVELVIFTSYPTSASEIIVLLNSVLVAWTFLLMVEGGVGGGDGTFLNEKFCLGAKTFDSSWHGI